MSEYSGYQPKRAHSLGPFTSVHEATAPDGKPGRFALKIFHPPASTNIRRAYAIEGWLLAAERQQKNAKKDGAVLEVLACGRCAEGAYAVMPWQERSVEPFVTILGAKGDHLRALAECLLNTLEQWEAQTGGPHGKVKPSNVFFTRSGALTGMTAALSDAAFVPGANVDKLRQRDLTAVGVILAQIVRRRAVAAWPIEDAPEWKRLQRPGKAWLEFCNYLLNPQPAAGELTIAEARKRLRKIPKDARPARTAALVGAAIMFVMAAGVMTFARFGNPIYMPDQIERLAIAVGNPRTLRTEVPAAWADLCLAWDTWLIELQGNGDRLLKTQGLFEPGDPLRKELADFVATANELLPATLVPQTAGEKRLGVLGKSPPENIRAELLTDRVARQVEAAGGKLNALKLALETWKRWEEMRALQKMLEGRAFTRAAAALEPRLPLLRSTPGYKLDVVRTLKLFNDVSLDEASILTLTNRWVALSTIQLHLESMPDRVQRRMPKLILDRLADSSSLGDFADLLVEPLAEMQKYKNEYNDPAVVPERFLKESPIQAETGEVTVADFPRWEQELRQYSKVPAAEDPRRKPELGASVAKLPVAARELDPEAPDPDPGGLPTLSTASFKTEYDGLTTNLNSFNAREIVRHDLPEINKELTQFETAIDLLQRRIEATVVLLSPDIWLGKVSQAYGKFNESKQRWAAWQKAALTDVTPAKLTGQTNSQKFRDLRANAAKLREWLDGLEGPEGFGALAVPDISAASADTVEALKQLENARREQAATDVAAAAGWINALPRATWAAASAAVRAPLEAHRAWLVALPAFSADLDKLSSLLADGFSWNEGVSEAVTQLAKYAGLDALTGPPAGWNTEARLLGRLFGSNDRAELTAAAQSGGLSRKLTAWRRLGTLTGWPAGAADLDVDGGVVGLLRDGIAKDLKDDVRRAKLTEELVGETRVRWNKAARNSAGNDAQLVAVFERMDKYHIAETDLEENSLYNLKYWRLRSVVLTETEIPPLRTQRDAFVEAVRALGGVMARSPVANFVNELTKITLEVDPNRKPTPSPRTAGWGEELIDDGLGLTATWKSGAKTVKLDFAVVQPADDTPPFYLAKRVIAVGDFLDLLATRPKESTAVLEALPAWARINTDSKPWNLPVAWGPRSDFKGLELNSTWILTPDALVQGLFDNTDLRQKNPPLDQAAAEKPTLRSPLQQVAPPVAKLFTERLLGARLPTPREWTAVLKVTGGAAGGFFRGPNFQKLWTMIENYHEAGQTWTWRPGDGSFLPMVTTPGATARKKFIDDGQAVGSQDESRFWFRSVDEGPKTRDFINLTGNVSVFLQDAAGQFYVVGGSVLSPPGVDFTQPQKVEVAGGRIGAKAGSEPYSDVGIRPAFDAPPGFKERYNLLKLVRQQKFLTW